MFVLLLQNNLKADILVVPPMMFIINYFILNELMYLWLEKKTLSA